MSAPYADAIPPEVRAEVLRRIAEIEAERGVRVFYACESGSRAWGFWSRDSDYDVRFLYAHPPAWYLSVNVEGKRDVIERPLANDLDVGGWDLRKALGLFWKSNPPLLEWLRSPVVYREETDVTEGLRALVPALFSPRQAAHHYFHMARGTYRDYLRGERVRRKRYFYALRPLLAVRWIEAGLGLVPTEFGALVDRLVPPGPLAEAIAELLAEKRAGAEVDDGPRSEPIQAFVEAELPRLEGLIGSFSGTRPEPAVLDAFFLRSLVTLWPDEARTTPGLAAPSI